MAEKPVLNKCWLCEREFEGPGYPTILGMECQSCGPPEPMGPTEQELAESNQEAVEYDEELQWW